MGDLTRFANILVASSMGAIFGIEAFHPDLGFSLAHGVAVKPSLHFQGHVHADAKRLLDPQRHFGRNRRLGVDQIG